MLLGRKREIQKELKKRFYSEYSSKCVDPENAPNIDTNFDAENPGMVGYQFVTSPIFKTVYSFAVCGANEYSNEIWVDCCTLIGVIGSQTRSKVRFNSRSMSKCL